MPPGGKVVSCAPSDSPVASLPFKIGRNLALSEVFTGNLSNEYVAEGNELSSVARASKAAPAGKEPAVNRRHISRRVIDISTSRRKESKSGGIIPDNLLPSGHGPGVNCGAIGASLTE